jgi:hypothetical protein
MDDPDWLVLLGADGVVIAVDGGAPTAWIRRHVEDCSGMPESVRAAARGFLRGLAWTSSSSVVRRRRLAREGPGSPAFTLLAVEAIPLRPVEVDLEALIRRVLEPLAVQAERARVALRLVHDVVTAHAGGLVVKTSTDSDDRGTSVTLWLPVR